MITTRKISIVIAADLFGAMLSVSNVVLLAEPGVGTRSTPLEETVVCTTLKDKKTTFCFSKDGDDEQLWRCDKQRNGTWKCVEVKGRPNPNSMNGDVPPDLRATVVRKAQALKAARKTKSP